MLGHLLIIDDDDHFLKAISVLFKDNGYSVDTANSGKKAIEKVKANPHGYSLVLLDFLMPEMNGAETAKKLRAINPDIFILILSADPSRDALKDTWKAGVLEFIEKGNHPSMLLNSVANWCHKYQETNMPVSKKAVESENERIISSINMVGRSSGMAAVAKKVHTYQEKRRNILILGESGVGKELVARALHNNAGPFLAVNCASHRANPTLLESALFGHMHGAFTGTVTDKKGVFESACGGTVFLDEIHNLSNEVQVSLLRLIQERKVTRIGSTNEKPVDFRLISAAKPDLRAAVDAGTFKADLYHRISSVQITVPALRNRPDDIEPLVAHFVSKWSRENRHLKSLLGRTLRYLMAYPWPGNVRELENVINELLDTSQKDLVGPEGLNAKFFEKSAPITGFEELSLPESIRKTEIDHVRLALKSSPTLCGAAKMIKLSPQSLLRLMEKHKISSSHSMGVGHV